MERRSKRALEAAAPLLVGFLSTVLGGLGATTPAQPHGAAGLDRIFLLMLAPLPAAAVVLLVIASRTYPRDVATALASDPGPPAEAA